MADTLVVISSNQIRKNSCSLNEQELKLESYREIITGPPKAVRRGSNADSNDIMV